MMVAARVAFGRKKRSGVRKIVASAMPSAVKAPAAGVSAPASKFTTERAKPPVTGNPPDRAEPTFAAPSAISSWSGSMRWRRLREHAVPLRGSSRGGRCLPSRLRP